MRHRAKCRENRSNHSGDMADFRFFKMVAVCHLGVETTHKEYLVVFVTVQKLVVNRRSNFDSMQILIFCTLSLNMPIHAPK